MKRLFLTSAVLGIAGAFGSAHAIPLTSSMVTIWSADTPGNNSGSPAQQGLPTAVGLFGGPLPLVAGNTAFANTIAYSDLGAGPNTIAGFFGNHVGGAVTPPGTCLATCQTTTLTQGGFAHSTVFRLTFTAPSN